MSSNFKPILYSTQMVKAILIGVKTQTRRLLKEEIPMYQPGYYFKNISKNIWGLYTDTHELIFSFKCPYEVGDILWVREIWQYDDKNKGYIYRADEQNFQNDIKWMSSLFMPKNACRIFLKITKIRIEKLLSISKEDAIAEGIESETLKISGVETVFYKIYNINNAWHRDPINSYLSLWDLIYHKKQHTSNPFVWVYEFERCDISFNQAG